MSNKAVLGTVFAVLLMVAWIALSAFAIVRAFQYDEIVAVERQRNTVIACLERGRTNDGVIGYLRDVGADADDIQRARAFFPSRSRDDCELAAAKTVSQP